ncbi:MAG: prephenate dehydrogenase, partial [Actinomycetota bacterium]|nr:prephenate dehydrogenase [Actinomycetota bacterium]
IHALSGLREPKEPVEPRPGVTSGGAMTTTADAPGALAAVSRAISEGNTGRARIPGKHGGGPTAYATVVVVVPDTAGALATLLTDIGEAGVNLEDLRLDHGLGLPFGLAEVSVLPTAAEHLQVALAARGWRVHD